MKFKNMHLFIKVVRNSSFIVTMLSLVAVVFALHQIRQVTGDSYCLICSNEPLWLNIIHSVEYWTKYFWSFQPLPISLIAATLFLTSAFIEKTLPERD